MERVVAVAAVVVVDEDEEVEDEDGDWTREDGADDEIVFKVALVNVNWGFILQ